MANTSRHASLAQQLRTLMEYRQRPESGEPSPDIQTNWRIDATRDVNPEDIEGMRVERRWRIRPSVEEIERSLQGVEFRESSDGTRMKKKRKRQLVPVGGDVERNEQDQIVRLGKLRFSDGTRTEKAYRYTIGDKLIQYDARMPAGSMLGATDQSERQLGGGENPQEVTASNRYFADMVGVKHRAYKLGGKCKRGKSYTHAESRKMLADAWENTNKRPSVTICPSGLACGTPRVADNFVGMKKGRCGDTGAQSWEDISTALVNREIWAESIAALSDQDKGCLNRAMVAGNMRDIGASFGKRGRQAWKVGRLELLSANENLRRNRRKFAA